MRPTYHDIPMRSSPVPKQSSLLFPYKIRAIRHSLFHFPYLSPVRAIEQPNGRLLCRWTQMHVALRGCQIGMTGNGSTGVLGCKQPNATHPRAI